MGSRYRFTSLASVGFVLVSSSTLRCAFDVFMRYVDLNASMVRATREDAVALALSRELLGRPVIPRAIEFTFTRP